mmetsp:Transcript_17542/g.29695  ORF Transcript_17542/g.29695 Transcript_17542/m.29695 type:complete len:83 (+) Transcript_17542:561-809(+)
MVGIVTRGILCTVASTMKNQQILTKKFEIVGREAIVKAGFGRGSVWLADVKVAADLKIQSALDSTPTQVKALKEKPSPFLRP